ncbi:hypothetical protein ERHA55_36150 [Erwinia rhapontici]|nr:hypothetical protein ERHA55_36150 [Erwinia rhapontici]
MSNPVMESPMPSTPDSTSLSQRLRKVDGVKTRRSLLLIAPLLIFVVVCFLFPIVSILSKSVQNPEIHENLPETSAALASWSGSALPDEAVYATLGKS